ncbi:MAG TPA: GntR family transcriptional regulator [Vicinamibacterales bacterium]|nr:GntR family transcriptional regulator [Vicinamibacterales bacterium]
MDDVLHSLADQAYAAIREEILRGRLRPGMPLSRRRLAEELQMSTVPVAEALRRLEDDRLVESRARAGTRVRIHSDADVRQLYELREALETQSARLFCQRATPGQRHELRRLAEQLDVLFSRLASDADAEFSYAVHTHHVQFHLRIAEYARSPLLKEMIERQHVLILNWLFDLTGRRTPLPPGFHARLADALVSRDVARADEAMRAHVRYGLAEVSGQIATMAASEWRESRARR